jgi:hypothetical protein
MKTLAQKDVNKRWVTKNRAILSQKEKERRHKKKIEKIQEAKILAITHF